jgi:hypothetical protein
MATDSTPTDGTAATSEHETPANPSSHVADHHFEFPTVTPRPTPPPRQTSEW